MHPVPFNKRGINRLGLKDFLTGHMCNNSEAQMNENLNLSVVGQETLVNP